MIDFRFIILIFSIILNKMGFHAAHILKMASYALTG